MLFSQATTLTLAIPLMITFAMFVKMSNGATYAVVPFINRRALGAVSGIVGAGGNAGAVALGFLFKSEAIDWHTALFIAGVGGDLHFVRELCDHGSQPRGVSGDVPEMAAAV